MIKIVYIFISLIVITFLIKNYFPYQGIKYLFYLFGYILLSLSYFERFSEEKLVVNIEEKLVFNI